MKNWFITGTSRGFGRIWAEAALRRGDRVVATARNLDDLAPLVAQYGDRVAALPLDVSDRAQVFETMAEGVARFGRLDVIVNNAGYGHVGMVEEVTEADARAQMDVNFFGALWVIQAALPHLRAHKGGHLITVSSIGGIVSFPTLSMYCASKWGVEALCEALAAEVQDQGIRVTLLEPSGYATDFPTASARHSTPLPAYDKAHAARAAARDKIQWSDPAPTADVILNLVDMEHPPLRLLLGKSVLDRAVAAQSARESEWRAHADLTTAG